MLRSRLLLIAIFVVIQSIFLMGLPPLSKAQEWKFRSKPRGTLKVADMFLPSASLVWNYAEGLVSLDKNNNVVPALAKDLRWIDETTIEFRLREDVRFHNGEKFNAKAVRVNWENYKRMKNPRPHSFTMLSDETIFEIVDDYRVRFKFPEPDGIVFPKFEWFFQIAPAFFAKHQFRPNNWGRVQEAGPWGTGPFILVEGSALYAKPTDQVVLEAYEDYWDPRYPKVRKVVFDNTLIVDRNQAMRLCMEKEGAVDIVSHIRPLDTLKVAESPFAKVVKNRDVTALVGLFNLRKRQSKCQDIRVRRALNFALNREELLKFAAKGNAHDLGGYIPAGAYGHNPSLTLYSFDITNAKSLLLDAGYADGFEIKILTSEGWKLESQIISKMLERTGVKVKLDVVTFPEWARRTLIPLLENTPEDEDWDIAIYCFHDFYGHTGTTFLTWGALEESDMRWIEYDPVYEGMWKEMARTVNTKTQEEKIRKIAQYVYERAYYLFIYSPFSLYAVNKEVNFLPQNLSLLRLKETSVTDRHWSVQGKSN